MPRKPHMLNVKRFLNWTIESCESMLERDGKHPGGLILAPIDKGNLREIAFFAKAILRKHEAKHTRKDIYVEH